MAGPGICSLQIEFAAMVGILKPMPNTAFLPFAMTEAVSNLLADCPISLANKRLSGQSFLRHSQLSSLTTPQMDPSFCRHSDMIGNAIYVLTTVN
jgi:hypothetical protein